MPEISRRVREAVVRRLADPSTGFNMKLAAVAYAYGIQPFSIDWTANSKNFFRGFVDPNDVDESTPSRYPLVMLYSMTSSNDHDSMPRLFSGKVVLGLDFHITWRAGNALKNFEDLGDAIEDAVYAVFSDGNWPQTWGAANAVQVAIALTKRPVEMGGESWRQSLMFRLTFQVDTD
ncbi:MAG: hypothetical protein ACM3S5_05835 [Rhodospirillales bacterium]